MEDELLSPQSPEPSQPCQTDQPRAWTSPLRIGNVEIGCRIVQAALSGYSDWPMRSLAREFGAGYVLHEVVLDQFLVQVKKRQRTKHILYLSDDERPVGGQLMGAEPEMFAEGAKRLVAAGFDVIDINFGCPVKKVLGRCRGGFHLSQPDIAVEIIRRTRDTVDESIPVTVKMRRGIDDSAESRDKFFAILDGAFAAGVAAVTVHGRTVEQRYIGPSQWSFLAEVKRHVGEKVVLGSGDLFTPHDCLRMLRETGVDGVTVARGAIGNPWIFRRTRALLAGQPLPAPPTLLEQREVIWEHFRRVEWLYGSRRAPVLMRKFAIKYARLHPEFPAVRAAMVAIRTDEDLRRVLHRWYPDDRAGVEPICDEVTASGSDTAG